MNDPTESIAFVAGATGYTGRGVVRVLTDRGAEAVAHIRPGSSRREACSEHFEQWGARIDHTPWDVDAIATTLAKLAPDVVFCLIGTTRARKSQADHPKKHTYEAVDYGLTELLVRACQQAGVSPRFVYLSAIGVGPNATGSYMKARWRAERCVVESHLPYTVVRPAFISGPGRSEFRLGERAAAIAGDAVLGVLGALGLGKLRDRYQSMTNTELAEHLVELALSADGENRVIDAYELRHR
jgi:nucleoside-diphosphate-sugar epimerase